MNIQLKMAAAITLSFQAITLCYNVRLRTKLKHNSQTQLCFMNGTLQCYMFLFPMNHPQSIQTKPVKYTNSTIFYHPYALVLRVMRLMNHCDKLF